MAVRALLAVSWLLFALPAAAQEKRTSLTEEDLERAKALDAEFRTLLGSEKPEVCAQLEEARVRILDKDSRWDYLKGFRTLRNLRSLQGRRIAFPSREAFVAYAVPKVALSTAGVRVDDGV